MELKTFDEYPIHVADQDATLLHAQGFKIKTKIIEESGVDHNNNNKIIATRKTTVIVTLVTIGDNGKNGNKIPKMIV